VGAVHAWEPPPTILEPGPAPGFDLVGVLPAVKEARERLVTTVIGEVVGEDAGRNARRQSSKSGDGVRP
jgi:hypothetical protein